MTLDPSKTVLQHCLDEGISLPHACGGEGKCSTCRVVVLEGAEFCEPVSILEKEIAERFSFPPNIRLGCQLRARQGISLRRLILDREDQTMISEIVRENRPVAVGVETSMAIVFVDIRGFTNFSEHLLPYDIVHVLNRFFQQMGEAVRNHGGEINNYMGDGFMALFPNGEASDCTRQALRAGLEMLERMNSVRDYIQALHERTFEIGIGIHFGKVIHGTFGHHQSQRTTVIGDVVNVASRIESMTKTLGVKILVSEEVYQHLKSEFNFCPKSEIEIRGKSGLFQLYTVLGSKEQSP